MDKEIKSRDVIVYLKGENNIEHDKDIIETKANGICFKKANSIYINYIDNSLENTKTVLSMEDEKVKIIRYGNINTKLVFEKNIEHKTFYSTLHGVFEISIKATDIKIIENEKDINISLKYIMDLNGEKSKNRINIVVRYI